MITSLGKIAYDAYCEDRDWKSVIGEKLPQFDQQSQDLRLAWEAAGVAVADAREKELGNKQPQKENK